MNIFKNLHKVAVFSALVLYGFSATPAHAAATVPVDTPAGTCVGDATHDCVTTTGHMSASVVTTLTINEVRAVSFGNMSVACTGACDGAASFSLSPAGVRSAAATTGTDAITLLHGAQANNNAGNLAGAVQSGGQAPGIYSVTTGDEGGTVQVYISFADNTGNPIDYSGESFYPAANAVTLSNGGGNNVFLANAFTMECKDTGGVTIPAATDDVYGHYCATNGSGSVDVAVGATLHTKADGALVYGPGKYTGTYNVMVSY